MREYFTVMFKENDTSNLKLLTEKLNAGFGIENQVSVGRSTVVTLSRYQRDNSDSILAESEPTPVFATNSVRF